jgi:hypothetical protein
VPDAVGVPDEFEDWIDWADCDDCAVTTLINNISWERRMSSINRDIIENVMDGMTEDVCDDNEYLQVF